MISTRGALEAIGADAALNSGSGANETGYFANLSGSIKISGSTTVQSIAQAAADRLMSRNKSLSISVAGGGSGAGVRDALAGTSNIGLSSRALTDSETKAGLIAVSVASDGIAIIVNPANPVKNLTMEQAAKIFRGEIRNWKYLGGDNAPILIQTRETGSGTRSSLEELLLNKTSVVVTATPHASSSLIKQAVARDVNAIGYDSVGFVDDSVKTVSVNGIKASADSVLSGEYPLARNLFALTRGRPSGVASIFIDYLRTAAIQVEIVENEGYIRLAN
jgi:phosphate transport system substrate-binding protein